MRRIAIFTPSLYGGGAERVSCILANSFAKNCNVFLYHRGKLDGPEYELDKNINKIRIKTNYSLYKSLKLSKPDVMVVMFAPMITKILPAFFLGGKDSIKIISERNDPSKFDGKKLTKYIYQNLMRFFDGVVFQTEEAKSWYSGKGIRNSEIIENPINVAKLPIPKLENRRKEIVSVGRLEPQKNQELLIKAFSRLMDIYPDYYLTIYGEGSLRPRLESIIRDLGLNNRVILPGNREDVLDQINGAALFVLSSNYEGMSNALIESLALGIPTIATDCPIGGSRQLIRNLNNGILVPIENESELVKAIDNVLGNKIDTKLLSNNALNIRKDLSVEVITCKWSNFIKSLSTK